MSEVCKIHFCVKSDNNLETVSIIKLQKHENNMWNKPPRTLAQLTGNVLYVPLKQTFSFYCILQPKRYIFNIKFVIQLIYINTIFFLLHSTT
jgi:hypothetical protein